MIFPKQCGLKVSLPMAFMGLFIYKQRRQDFSIKRLSISLFAHIDDKGARFLLED